MASEAAREAAERWWAHATMEPLPNNPRGTLLDLSDTVIVDDLAAALDAYAARAVEAEREVMRQELSAACGQLDDITEDLGNLSRRLEAFRQRARPRPATE